MIVVTAAAGMSGQAVVKALVKAGHEVRGASHHDPGDGLAGIGAVDFVEGDLLDPAVSARAVKGVDAVVHIGPPFHYRETDIGHSVLTAARNEQVGHFVQFSTIRPQIEPLLNHAAKLALERLVVTSRLPFTILAPVHYMQNIGVADLVKSGELPMPYLLDTPLSHVDLEDVAEVAALVVGQEDHFYASYELCGADRLTVHDIARIVSEVSGTMVTAKQIDAWVASPEPMQSEADDFRLDSMRRLFDFYGRYGVLGNPRVLEYLLGRPVTTFADYVRRSLA